MHYMYFESLNAVNMATIRLHLLPSQGEHARSQSREGLRNKTPHETALSQTDRSWEFMYFVACA